MTKFKLIARAVRREEKNFKHMFNIDDVIVTFANIKNQKVVKLSKEEIDACEEGQVKPKKSKDAFIKKYHHFQYAGEGVLLCQYIKGEGDSQRHEMKQISDGTAFVLRIRSYLIERSAISSTKRGGQRRR